MTVRDRYELEASALWAHLQALASRAPRLERLYARDADPRVARLVQSAAFAFASAHDRLDDDGQAMVRPLVALALPESLRPRPSSTVVELSAAGGRTGRVQGATFLGSVGPTAIPFQTVWPVPLAPLALEGVRLDRVDARRQVLRFTLGGRSGTAFAQMLPDALRMFVHLEPRAVALDVIHALRSSRAAGRARWLDEKGRTLSEVDVPPGSVSWVQIDTEESSLVSARSDRFRAGALLRDLFAFPESFCFFDLRLVRPVPSAAARVEITLPLAHLVEDARLGAEQLRLFCAPATNQFVAPIEPVDGAARSEVRLRASSKPHAEILEVRELVTTSAREARRRTLRSAELEPAATAFEPDDTYYRLEQRLSATDGRTELRARFGRAGAFPSPPGGLVEGEVLACDGSLCASLGLGDIGSVRAGAVNISRVTPSRRATLGENLAWRLSAYARMPPARLAECARLGELLDLHDAPGIQDDAVRVRRPRLARMQHASVHSLSGGVLGWGDQFELDVQPDGCRGGELWLLGALVHRALAERNELLRTTALTVRREGAPFAEYGPLAGSRLPFPLG